MTKKLRMLLVPGMLAGFALSVAGLIVNPVKIRVNASMIVNNFFMMKSSPYYFYHHIAKNTPSSIG